MFSKIKSHLLCLAFKILHHLPHLTSPIQFLITLQSILPPTTYGQAMPFIIFLCALLASFSIYLFC